MRSTITLNGKNSSEIEGLLIQSLPPISKPLMRTQIDEIDGRDGDIVTNLGFSAYTKEFTIGLYGNFDINEVISYFNSEGTVIFSNEPDMYYNYQIINQIDFERLIRFRTATVSMHCQPFKYSATESPILMSGSNLITFNDFTQTKNGVTVTASNGDIKVNGTATAATEIYLPINNLTLEAGDYILEAFASGTAPEACSIRVVYESPSAANSFGGTYVTLQNEKTVTIQATLSGSKTYNYIYFYITSGKAMNFTLGLDLVNMATKIISGEGNNIVLSGTAEVPFNNLDTKGDTFQQTYTGKNLLNVPSSYSIVGGGVDIKDSLAPITSGTYTVSCGDVVKGGNNNPNLGFSINGTTTWVSLAPNSYKTIEIPSQPAHIYTYSNGADYAGSVGKTSTVNNLMIEQGSTATSYEPYVGGIPSPNPDYPQDIQVVSGEQTVKVHGKNLFNIQDATGTRGNNTVAANEQTIVLNSNVSGTETAFYLNDCSYISQWLPGQWQNARDFNMTGFGGNYTLKVYYQNMPTTTATMNTTIYTNKQQILKNRAAIVDGVLTVSISLDNDEYIKSVAIYTAAANIFNDFTVKAQLEQGSTATTYEPYQGENYTISLVNMFDAGSVEAGDIKNSNANIRLCSLQALWLEAGTYTFSSNITSPYQYSITINDAGSPFLSSYPTYDYDSGWKGDSTTTFTITKGGWFVAQFRKSNNSELTVSDISQFNFQLNRGSTITSPIELCKIGAYQDYIYKSGDDWYVKKETGKVVLDGNANVGSYIATQGDYFITQIVSNLWKHNSEFIADRFSYKPNWGTGYNYESIYYGGVNGEHMDFKISSSRLASVTVANIKTWFGSNNTTVYYQLATPTDTKITDSTLIEQLESLSNAHAYKNFTHITATAIGSNLPYIIAASVLGEVDGTVTNSGNTIARPKLTVYGSGNIGIYLNGVQMFEVALGTDEYITIDTNAMEAYKDTTNNLKNRLVTGDYNNFVLNIGDNQISFSGKVSMCVVENYSRWL